VAQPGRLPAGRRDPARLRSQGLAIYIEGALRTRSWDDRQTGQRRYRSEIVVTEISLLSPPPDGGSDDVEHYVSGQGFAPPEFSEEPEMSR
jgi:single-stranded DNA-binding protein